MRDRELEADYYSLAAIAVALIVFLCFAWHAISRGQELRAYSRGYAAAVDSVRAAYAKANDSRDSLLNRPAVRMAAILDAYYTNVPITYFLGSNRVVVHTGWTPRDTMPMDTVRISKHEFVLRPRP